VIIDRLSENGLWKDLQPEADAKMRADPAWRAQYLRGFTDLNTQPEKKGACMAALIRPYLEKTIDWKQPDLANTYKTVFAQARRFLAPAALPRFDLDAGLRLIFAEHQITVRKIRLQELKQRRLNPH
jgi:hypothetical protein